MTVLQSIFVSTLLIAASFFPISCTGQVYQFTNKDCDLYRVETPSGVNMRNAPTAAGDKIKGIANGDYVLACEHCESSDLTIENKVGCWKKVNHHGTEGFVFSGFLSKAPAIVFTCQQDWIGYKPVFEKGREYFGIYPMHQWGDERSVAVRLSGKDTLVDIYSDQREIMLTFNFDSIPAFVISGLPLHDGQFIPGQFINRMLFPGDFIYWNNNFVFADGKLERSDNIADPNPFKALTNYQLILRIFEFKEQQRSEYLLFKNDFPAWGGGGFEGHNVIRWIGDIDGDGKMDMIVTDTTYYACWNVHLLLSSFGTGGHPLQTVVKYGACGC